MVKEMYTDKYFRISKIIGQLFNSHNDKDAIIMKMKPHKRFLDIGCGNFAFLKRVKERGLAEEIYGIDIVDRNPPNGIKFFKANAEERLPFPDEFFDGASCMHLLEHLERPENCIREVRRVLKEGGLFYLILPRELFRGYSVIFVSILMSILDKKPTTPWRIHKKRFEKEEILKLLKGFKIESFEVISQSKLPFLKSYVVVARKI